MNDKGTYSLDGNNRPKLEGKLTYEQHPILTCLCISIHALTGEANQHSGGTQEKMIF